MANHSVIIFRWSDTSSMSFSCFAEMIRNDINMSPYVSICLITGGTWWLGDLFLGHELAMPLSFSLHGCTSFLLPWYWHLFTLTLQLIDHISSRGLTFSSFQLSIYNQNLSEPWVRVATQRACKPCQQQSSVLFWSMGNVSQNCHTPNIFSPRHMHVQSPIAKTIQDPLCAVGIVRMPQIFAPWRLSPQFPRMDHSQSQAKSHIVHNLFEHV